MNRPASGKRKITKVIDKKEVKPPSNKEVLKTLEVLMKAVQHRGNNFNIQSEYEQYISGILEHNSKQTKITNFFHK